jgi:hypothetical protein
MTGTGECCRQYLLLKTHFLWGGDFDMEPGRRPPMAPSRPRVPTMRESGEYISICASVSEGNRVIPSVGLDLGIVLQLIPQ